MKPLVIVGAGGFGRETIDVVHAINQASSSPQWDLVGVVDDAPSAANLERISRIAVPYLGTLAELASITKEAAVAIGVGKPDVRTQIIARLARMKLHYATLLHPNAVIGSDSRISTGAIICAGVSIGCNVELGAHVHVNPHAVIGHDAVLEDCVSVNPNATVSGDCRIGRGTLLGAGAVVLEGLTVHANSIVGAAACVTACVPPNSIVVGVPARPKGIL